MVGGPRPVVCILTARHRTRPKWCHPGVPSEPTKTDVSGCSMNVRALSWILRLKYVIVDW